MMKENCSLQAGGEMEQDKAARDTIPQEPIPSEPSFNKFLPLQKLALPTKVQALNTWVHGCISHSTHILTLYWFQRDSFFP